LRLKTLGVPQIMRGAVAVPFKRKKALALLVYLARTGRVHTRDTLAALLVDEASDEQARSQLRNTLHDLTTQVGDHVLVTRQTVAFDRGKPYWLDIDEVELAVHGADDPASDPAALERAVALYEGEFLAGLALTDAPEFDRWRLPEQERLHGLLLQALHLLLTRARRADDVDAAERWATRLLEAEPWHEEAHRQLMRLLARRGQRDAALAQYEVCRRTLAEELGSEPEPETIALYERLRAGPLAPPGNLPAPPPGFVGREAELALVAERLADPGCRLALPA
jgi:DNA-binding SARP family transcriptional activator